MLRHADWLSSLENCHGLSLSNGIYPNFVVPVKEGLAALFDSLVYAETMAKRRKCYHPQDRPGMPHCFQATVTLSEATRTYPLRTVEDWRAATLADHDLAILLKSLAKERRAN
jgi:hypothetical protein